MAKLDNTGTTFLDCVLTETGRRLLAQGNFKVTKFGLGDDEVNYILYKNTSDTPWVDITKIPVNEANSDRVAALQYNLVSYDSQEYTYLPTAAVVHSPDGGNNEVQTGENAGYRVLLTDQTSVDKFTNAGIAQPPGYQTAVYDGTIAASDPSETGLVLDFGVIFAAATGYTRYDKPAEFQERYYHVQLDDRFLKLLIPRPFVAGAGQAPVQTAETAPNLGVDDQNIRTYEIGPSDHPTFFKELSATSDSPIKGAFSSPRANWKVAPTALLRSSLEAWTSGIYPTQLISNWFTNVNPAMSGDAIVLDTPIMTMGGNTGVSNTSFWRLVKAI